MTRVRASDRCRTNSNLLDLEILRYIVGLADQASTKLRRPGEDLDFADLFQAFEAFTNENDLTRSQYSNYFTCLNIIVNLCNFPEESWSLRLSSYLRTYSASELRKAHNIALREKLRSFDSITRERFLSLWYESYAVLQDKDNRLSRIAIQQDSVRIVRNAFYIWRSKFSMIRNREYRVLDAREFLLKRRTFGELIFKYKLILENRALADKRYIHGKFSIWQKQAFTISSNTEKALAIEEKKLKRNSFDTWDKAKEERLISRMYNDKLVYEFFDLWRQKTQDIVARDVAVDTSTRNTISSAVLSHWITRLSLFDDLTNKAISMSNILALRHTFMAWKRRAVYDSLYEYLELKKNSTSVRRVFHNWRRGALMLRKARQFREFTCCSDKFRAWRVAVRFSRLVTVRNADLAAKHLRNWRLNQRFLDITRIQNTRIALKALDFWRFKKDEINLRTNCNYVQFVSASNNNLAHRYLLGWRAATEEIILDEEEAIEIYNEKIAKHALNALLYADNVIIENEEVAQDLYVHNVKKSFFARWKKARANLIRERREITLQKFIDDKDTDLQILMLDKWVNRYLDVQDLGDNATLIYTQRNMMFRTQYWNKWLEQTRDILQKKRTVDTFIRRSLLQTTMSRWKEAKARLDSQHAKCEVILSKNIQPILEGVYRTWRMRMFKLKTKKRDADDFHQRISGIRLRNYWKLWKQKSKEDRGNKLQGEVPSSSFKALPLGPPPLHNPETTFRPELPYPETPTRQRIRNPVAATTGGRWRRNKAINNLDFNI